MSFDYDVIIVGGGPAGLSAALLLGRSRRKVLVCDEGNYRNRFSHHMHAFISRDGISPKEFLDLARADATKYPTVDFQTCRVKNVSKIENGFEISMESCGDYTCKKLLLATGLTDLLPPITNVDRFYGKGVHHCPYCDGWEVQDKRIGVYGCGENGRQMALEMTCWSSDVTLFTDGVCELSNEHMQELAVMGVSINEQKIRGLVGDDDQLRAIEFTSGQRHAIDALFFKTARFEKSLLAEKLGCDIDENGLFLHEKFESTNVPGVFIAGDASKSLNLVIEAAASGAEAAFAINTSLIRESIKDRLREAGNLS